MCSAINIGPGSGRRQRIGPVFGILLAAFLLPNAFAAEVADGLKLLSTGKYAAAIEAADKALEDDRTDEDWTLIKVRAQMATGKYADAIYVVTNAFKRYPLSTSIRLKLLARDVFLFNGFTEEADSSLTEINRLAGTRTWAYQDPVNIATLGITALQLGADPKLVLDRLLKPALNADDTIVDTHLAVANLAMSKGDFQMAANQLRAGLKILPDEPDLYHALALAFRESDRNEMLKAVKEALDRNENHVPCKLLMIDHLIDGEQFDEAEKKLAEVLAVNEWQPEAWAYRSVIAHLKNQPKDETKFRSTALKHYSNNPEIDHLIGRKLSQKYRFREGAAAQRQALVFDEDHVAAKIQLAQDLLRLGADDEKEGWELAAEVHEEDGFDVTAYNLVTLKDTTDKYVALTNANFVVRMEKREATIWGDRALALLEEAHRVLSKKYDIDLLRTTIVEIFASQNDFGVRTFGMPGNPGFLGVCFGSVITANSPSTQADSPSNWEAVLWHEFAHVITLTKTKNKMPRWLSEGISVYEELKKNPSWGQRMTPRYVQMIDAGDLTPVSRLSLAFLTPKSPEHLQFAYYESYLVVDYIVREFGIAALRGILDDLGKGDWINIALARHCKPIEELDGEFDEYVKELAANLAPGLDFADPKEEKGVFGGPILRDDAGVPINPVRRQNNNYFRLSADAMRLIRAEKYEEAKILLKKIIEHYPDDISASGALRMMAKVHRELEEDAAERKLLVRLALQDSDGLDINTRLLDLEVGRENWTGVQKYARHYLAINPLHARPYRFQAMAFEKTDRPKEAIAALEKVLLFEPADPADVHFRLASLLAADKQNGAARRHVLKSLEEAPRYREAHRLLLKLSAKPKGAE
jgi:tetratricopeptide (TPR) repeat protein